MKLCQSSGNLLYLTKAVLLSIKSGRGGAHWDAVATRRWSWSRWSDVAPEKKLRAAGCAHIATDSWRSFSDAGPFYHLYFSSATCISVQPLVFQFSISSANVSRDIWKGKNSKRTSLKTVSQSICAVPFILMRDRETCSVSLCSLIKRCLTYCIRTINGGSIEIIYGVPWT